MLFIRRKTLLQAVGPALLARNRPESGQDQVPPTKFQCWHWWQCNAMVSFDIRISAMRDFLYKSIATPVVNECKHLTPISQKMTPKSKVRLHRCWWRVMVTKSVSDNFGMLVTTGVTMIKMLAPTYKIGHQHPCILRCSNHKIERFFHDLIAQIDHANINTYNMWHIEDY